MTKSSTVPTRKTTTLTVVEDGTGNITVREVTQTADRTDTRIECTEASGTRLRREITFLKTGAHFDRTVAEDGKGQTTTTEIAKTRGGTPVVRTRSRNNDGRSCLSVSRILSDGTVHLSLTDSMSGVTRRMERITRPQPNKAKLIETQYWGPKGETWKTEKTLSAEVA